MLNAQGVRHVILEMDSLLFVNMLTGVSSPSWELEEDILKMRKIIQQQQQITVQHCYREGNIVVDALAKFGGE